MGYIFYDLRRSDSCRDMAPAALADGTFSDAALPAGMDMAGIYIIVNTQTNNRYVGISSNIKNRFNTRLATVTEMGFHNLEMQRIGVTWGSVSVRNSLPPATYLPQQAAWPVPGSTVVSPPPFGSFVATVDGQSINLEKLLIRFVLRKLGAGGTVSNNAMAYQRYDNPTADIIKVCVAWGDMGGLFQADYIEAEWYPGIGHGW
ncbi:GIY-YIG nuclease family protein [Azospirillum isscasi]|uniref:GIY-YIG nuclease family protein n=1 Tax=Azospirillum isscasi TaxID=3053926 RepID=A0ABU0WDJ2_9PROT|nr:GIY-YIG nuclease family protein [Azospirillum isscasi]MDQ2102267.1 GIY-YIG nuclease family protein [Azospirillum isscasi]